MDDRKITLQAIRYLSQVAEAIGSQILRCTPGAPQAIEASVRCSDHAEHIAQYDIEGLPLATRMRGVAESMEWLMVIVRQYEDLLGTANLNVPSHESLESVAAAAVKQFS